MVNITYKLPQSKLHDENITNNFLRGVEWDHCLFLFPFVFMENVVVNCKIESFLCSLDTLLPKNVIVFFFKNQI